MSLSHRLRTVIVLCLALTIHSIAFAQPEEDSATVHQINPHLYRIEVQTNFDFNVIVSVGEDGVLLVDTGWPHTAKIVRDALATITDQPIRYIALSHGHPDHTGGVPLLRGDATLVLRDTGVELEYYNLPPRRTFDDPLMVVSEPTSLTFNGERIEFIPLPAGHSYDEMLIYFTDSKLIFVGSRMIGGGYIYADLKRGDLDEMLVRMDRLRNDYPDARFALAHGNNLTASELLAYSTRLRESIAVVNKAFEAGKTSAEIAEMEEMKAWDDLQGAFVTHTVWANMVGTHHGHIPTSDVPSVCDPLSSVVEKQGAGAVKAAYLDLKESSPEAWDYFEAQVNMLGYELIYRDRLEDAITVFKTNIDLFPESANVYDSHGEALLIIGDTTAAIAAYRHALEVNPDYANARSVLGRLGVEE